MSCRGNSLAVIPYVRASLRIVTAGSPYAGRLIVEKQGFEGSISESIGDEFVLAGFGGSERRNQKEVLKRKTCECNVAPELREVVTCRSCRPS